MAEQAAANPAGKKRAAPRKERAPKRAKKASAGAGADAPPDPPVQPDSDDEPGLDEDASRYFEQLRTSLLALSRATAWSDACAEWRLETIEDAPGGTCVCGKSPITKRCHLVNEQTNQRAVVGSSCVRRFDGSAHALKRDCTSAFESLRRVAEDPWGVRASAALVALAEQRGALKPEIAAIVRDIGRKRPTERQLALLARANVDVLNHFFAPPPCDCGGALRLRINTKNGTLFYGCAAFPECRRTQPDPLRRARGTDVVTRLKRSTDYDAAHGANSAKHWADDIDV